MSKSRGSALAAAKEIRCQGGRHSACMRSIASTPAAAHIANARRITLKAPKWLGLLTRISTIETANNNAPARPQVKNVRGITILIFGFPFERSVPIVIFAPLPFQSKGVSVKHLLLADKIRSGLV